MKESGIQTTIHNALGRLRNVRVFRNNVGMAWTGLVQRITAPTSTEVYPGDVVIRRARPLHAGLVKGSGDLIGWTTITVRPEDVGRTLAVFTSVEVKAERGPVATEQAGFAAAVQQAGGFAGIARSVDEALEICRVKP